MDTPDVPDYVVRNRTVWDSWAPRFLGPGERAWTGEPSWGEWGVPDAQIGALPEVAGKDAIELGCGTAYLSAWLARRGASPVGIDNSPAQLANARAFQQRFSLPFPLLQAAAERLPFADDSFDIAISEYGASIWCDPYRWVPEAARVLRPGGELIFLVNGAIAMLCMPDAQEPATATMIRDYFGMHRLEWSDDDSVEFHLGHGDWIRLLRANGFEIEDLIEIRAPEDGQAEYSTYITHEWARRWPSEEIWKARLRA